MKILVVNNFFPPRRGGSAHLSYLLTMEYVRNGHEVIVLTTKDKHLTKPINDEALNVIHLRSKKLPQLPGAFNFDIPFAASFRNFIEVRNLMRTFCPDIIHQHGQFLDLTWITGILSKWYRIRTVLSVHTRLESTSRASSFVLRQLDRFIVRPVLLIYKPNIIVMDKLMEEYINERYSGVSQNMARINVGISSDWFHLTRSAFPDDGEKIISSVGHVIDLRNRITLVKATALLVEKYPRLQIWVVGEVYSTKFIDLAHELGVIDNFRLLGSKSQDFIKELYRMSSVEAHDIEGIGLGTSSIEALASGTPVIAAVAPDHFFNEIDIEGLGVTLIAADDHTELAFALDSILSKEKLTFDSRSAYDYFYIGNVAQKHFEYFQRIMNDT